MTGGENDREPDDQPSDKDKGERSPRRTFNMPGVDTTKLKYFAPFHERMADFKARGIKGVALEPKSSLPEEPEEAGATDDQRDE